MAEATATGNQECLLVDETNAVESLFLSCASIRRRTRSCLILSNPSEAASRKRRQLLDAPGDSYYARRIREEEETAVELERKILEYRSAIQRRNKRRKRETQQQPTVEQQQQASSKAATKAATRQYRQARSKLLDETMRQQLESVLLKRISMSQPAVEAAFSGYYSSKDEKGGSGDCESVSGHKDRKILLQEAVKCQNKQATRVLETQRKLDKVKRQLVLESEEGQKLQDENRELWNALQQLKAQKQTKVLAANGDDSTNNDEEQRLAAENIILKRVLADIISGSSGLLDWYSDEQLRETFLRLEH